MKHVEVLYEDSSEILGAAHLVVRLVQCAPIKNTVRRWDSEHYTRGVDQRFWRLEKLERNYGT